VADFPIFDADNHFYETTDALTKYLPPNRRDAVRFMDVDGRKKIVLRGQISEYLPNPTFDRIGRPGAQEDYFKNGNPEGKLPREVIGRGIDCPPAFRNAADRLEHMNEQNLDGALMMPTLVSLIEERMRDDPDLCADVIHAFNEWMVEEFPFFYEGRIVATPYITPGLVDRAVAELEWVIERGAKAVLMRPAPAWGYRGPRSFGLKEFDPFWRLIEDSGVVPILHVSDSGYDRYYNEWQGVEAEMSHFGEPEPFLMSMLFHHRPIEDTVTSLICHGTFWRFPEARVACVETGSGWVPGLLAHLDLVSTRLPQKYEDLPSETFKRNVFVQPNHEEDPRPLIDTIGVDRVIFGSDYPHTEGMADPLSYLSVLDGFSDEDQRKIMGGNALQMLNIPEPALT
jgi:predicted TIM-barrel fold metal-dependent hydrolase